MGFTKTGWRTSVACKGARVPLPQRSSESSSESSSERAESLTSLACGPARGKTGIQRFRSHPHNSASTKGIFCDE